MKVSIRQQAQQTNLRSNAAAEAVQSCPCLNLTNKMSFIRTAQRAKCTRISKRQICPTTRFQRHRHKFKLELEQQARTRASEDQKLRKRSIKIITTQCTLLTLVIVAAISATSLQAARRSTLNGKLNPSKTTPQVIHWTQSFSSIGKLQAAGGLKSVAPSTYTKGNDGSGSQTIELATDKVREVRQVWPISIMKSLPLKHPADVFLTSVNTQNSDSFSNNKQKLMLNGAQSPAGRPVREVAIANDQHLTPSSGTSAKCALILQRTYVRKLSNDIESDPDAVEPTGRAERVCISYESVDKAIEEAKRRREFQLTDDLQEAIQSIEPLPSQISKLGELNLEVVKVLKEQFDLSPDEILNGLPLIDMSKTKFWPLCPLMVKPIKCDPTGRFRSFTGHCNNLQNPTWGASQTPFVRYLPPVHSDGIEEFRQSVVEGALLPPARLVSSTVHRDVDHPSGDLSLLIMVFGQFVDHELTQAAPPRDENGLDFNCCKEPNKSEYCSPIHIPEKDPLYSKYGQSCMDFKRSLVGLRPNCRLGPRVHINTITPTIDGNTIYGSTKAVADQLRSFSGGLLKVQQTFRAMNLKPLLPKQLVRPDLDCFERPSNVFCFLAGDDRVNEQPTLTVMHTLMMRDHNRLAGQLAKLNQHWDDERIYHETRHLIAAKISAIIQNEYLPMLIGRDTMEENNLTSTRPGQYSNYDPNVNVGISQGFTTAAFRQGHTFIQGQLRLHDSRSHNFLDSIPLRRLFKRPFHYYSPWRMDSALAGIVNTPAQSFDPFISQEIAGHLFQEPGEDFGMDLISINLQRGREQGVPGYVAFREAFTRLPKVRTFEDLLPTMSNRTVYLYSRLYKSVHDIDLWSGGVSEMPKEGALVGPTFAAIIGQQFAHTKAGDRFWYENGQQPSSFTQPQLREIKRASLARLLCANSDGMQFVQRKALRLAHAIYNPRVACKDLDDIDLRFWREDPNNLGSFQQQ